MEKILRKISSGLWFLIIFTIFITLTVSFEFILSAVNLDGLVVPRTKAREIYQSQITEPRLI